MLSKSAFINIIGAPNVGKSTLTNLLVGNKVSIVSPKVQTTRVSIKAIVTIDNTQLVFIDNPGIFQKASTELEKRILNNALHSLIENDFTLLLIDAVKGIRENDQYILDLLKKKNINLIGVINKVDTVKKNSLLCIAKALWDYGNFQHIFMISALKNDGVSDLLNCLMKEAPESPWFYDQDSITTSSSRFIASEIIREKLFFKLNEELPYNLAVIIDNWQELENKSIKIDATIYIAKASHKSIIIGKKGAIIKQIGQEARLELKKIFDTDVHLFLYVKVKGENWLKDMDVNLSLSNPTL
jgi:GTP-binding protein Era